MALIVEDGTPPANANTYLDVAGVDAYFLEVGKVTTAWDALTTPQQEAAIIRATRYHESEYGSDYQGCPQTKGQSLSWPREGVTGLDGYEVPMSTVIDQVRWAQAELVYRTFDGTELYVDVAPATGDLTYKRRKVGELETEDRFDAGGSATQTDYTKIDKMLEPFLLGSDVTPLLMRA